MSSITTHSGNKRRQTCQKEDIISNLPESIRCHILSLLPTDDAVFTSLLSTKWKFLWKNIHILTFNDTARWFRNYDTRDKRFVQFVNKVLLLLNQQTIDKFSLDISEYSELYDVTTWIDFVVAKKVKVINFRLTHMDEYELQYPVPSSVFTCKTLEVLILHGFMHLSVPTLITLPNVKTLHFRSVNFQCYESIGKIVSACSSLETLLIHRSWYHYELTITVSSPSLRNLTLYFLEEDNTLDYPTEPEVNTLDINAPQLRYLKLSAYLSRNFFIENLCLLDEAILDLYLEKVPIDNDHYSKTVLELLQGVNRVKILSLKGNMFKCLNHTTIFPSFSRLTELTFETKSPEWNLLLNLVNNMNKLESLTIIKGNWNDENLPVISWSKPEKVPICLLSCLVTLTINGLEDLEDELAMLAYILKNAKVLTKVTIKAKSKTGKFELLQKISEFSRGSEECKIAFT